MKVLNRKLCLGLPVFVGAALVFSGVAGGIELVLASLGALVLIGIVGISIYALVRVLRHDGKLFEGGFLECSGESVASFNGDNSKYAPDSNSDTTGPISKDDKKLIMEHIDELFTAGLEPVGAVSISKDDKKLIMEHIDELFTAGLEPVEAVSISEEDKNLIMEHINELFGIGGGQSLGKSS